MLYLPTIEDGVQILQIDASKYLSGLCLAPLKLIATCPAWNIYAPFDLVECDSEFLLVGRASEGMVVYRGAVLHTRRLLAEMCTTLHHKPSTGKSEQP